MLAFVALLVGVKDLAVLFRLIPDQRYSLTIFVLATIASYVFHEAVRNGLLPWFEKRDER